MTRYETPYSRLLEAVPKADQIDIVVGKKDEAGIIQWLSEANLKSEYPLICVSLIGTGRVLRRRETHGASHVHEITTHNFLVFG